MSAKGYLADREENLWETYKKLGDSKGIVKGYPDDLVSCVLNLRAEGRTPSLPELVEEFYAPPPITLAFLKKAEEKGVLSVSPDRVCTKEEGSHFIVKGLGIKIEPRDKGKYYLTMKEAIEKENALVRSDRRVRVFVATPGLFPFRVRESYSQAVEIKELFPEVDPLYVRGVSFGVYDYVIADLYPSWEDAVCDLVCANLKPYGVAFLGYVVGDKGGYTLKDILGTMEERHGLFVTDVYRRGYVYVFRVVKYPELLALRRGED